MTRAPRGFTLIELLIAIALMSVLAVLCWRGLDSVVRSRDRIAAASDELRAYTVAFAQMEDDLRRSWVVRLLQLPVVSTIVFAADTEGSGPSVELLRESGGALEPLRVQRVVYRVRGGLLERGFAPWVTPSPDAGTASATVPLVWQPLAAGVAAMDMRAWIDTKGWASATAVAAQQQAARGTTTNASPTGAGTGAAGATTSPGGTSPSGTSPGGTAAGGANPPGTAAQPGMTITGIELTLAMRDGTRLVRVFPVKE